MKALFSSLAILVLALSTAQAGVSGSSHSAGFGGGSHASYGVSRGSYEGYHGNYGTGYSRGYGSYRRFGCSPYSYGYGYYPGVYGSYSVGYDSLDYGPSYSYDSDSDTDPSAYPSPSVPPPDPSTPAGPATVNPAPAAVIIAPAGSIPIGKLDQFGYVHSPFTTTTFKVATVADGQVFHDPITGQIFQVHVPAKKPAPPATGAMPTGKLDEFGYVHSPYSTFTFKVADGNYNQVFHDPFTGQPFSVRATRPASSAQVD